MKKRIKKIQEGMPKKLGQALLMAVDGLEECEQHPNYTINMYEWHKYSKQINECYVCLAGGLMAKILAFPFKKTINLTPFEGEFCSKLGALDDVRVGSVEDGIRNWYKYAHPLDGSDLDEEEVDRLQEDYQHIVDYSNDPSTFKRQIRLLGNDLLRLGY